MDATDFRYQFALHRGKIVSILLLGLLPWSGHAQIFRWAHMHNPHYDDKKITYGFMIGIHTSSYQIKYSDSMVTHKFDTVHSVVPSFSPGFSLGFLVNLRANDVLDFRIMPKAGFYDQKLTYYYTNGTSKVQEVSTTVVELPILFKYKSQRRGNVRMYVVGGMTPGIEASGKNDVQSQTASLSIKKTNLTLDVGMGFDFYFPLFKYSQEIRFSRGIVNMLGSQTTDFTAPLSRINTNTISVYFIFQ
jgi:Outer membrane protein beta-barrel domain